MLLIFRRSYLGCWGGGGWGLPIVVNVLCSSGSKWLNHWTKKRKWNVPWVSQWLFFFSKKYRKVGLYILKVPHCGLGQNILKDEVTEVKMKSLHYVGLTAICHHWVKYICVQASKAQKSSWDDGFELLSLSAFKFQILKANPFVGQGYPATWVEFHLQLWSVTARYQHLMNSVFVRERVGVCVWTASAHWKIDYLYSKWVGQNKHQACSGFKDCGGAVTQHWHGSDTRCQHQPWWSSGR